MEFLILGLTAFAASLLTFFSGFGLGTLLTPVFAVFFPIDIAIGLTGIVHLLNNLFKVVLIGRHFDRDVLLRFGITSVLGAFIGAWVLVLLAGEDPLLTYRLGTREFFVTPVKLVIAFLMVGFTLADALPALSRFSFGPERMPAGGMLSGFFGGLSGHQGALRTMFLIKANLSKEGFIATGVIIACFVDLTRLAVYSGSFIQAGVENVELLAITVACAFAGAYLGNKLLKKVTLGGVQKLVTVLLLLLAAGIGTGLI